MFQRKILMLAVLVASFALLAPSALARGGHHGGPGERDARGAAIDRQDVPSRVSSRLKRASRALDKAEERVDDGETAGAISSLSAVRKNLASAQKSGNKRVTANADDGPASAWALTNAQHKIVDATAALFDGVTETTLVSEIEETLDAALTGRDATVDAIGALPVADQQAYRHVLEGIDEEIDDEVEAIDEALSDDTLTPEATTALNDAKAQAQATQTEVRALLTALGSSSTSASQVSDGQAGDGRDCPEDGSTRAGAPARS
ncbi:MAG TPA: hypothetical protein VF517_02535 [Thermoleophilaceae bacterium]|jgi:hypothetical protein